jgi:hypothetical protein
MQDLYERETWQCNGFRSTGQLFVTGNLRLTFTTCGQFLATNSQAFYKNELTGEVLVNPAVVPPGFVLYKTATKSSGGEPTMEKVVAFRYLSSGSPVWDDVTLYTGYWNWGCATLYWRARTYRRPLVDGCFWRYQY